MRNEHIGIRTDKGEKEDIKKTAQKEKRTVSNYLLWLHAQYKKEGK